MNPSDPVTRFAAAERSSPEEIEFENEHLRKDPVLGSVLDGCPSPMVLLNQHRQIVLANDKISKLLGCGERDLLGKRPGEALGCIHSGSSSGGCGTTRYCRHCGAVQSVLHTLETATADTEECRIVRQAGGATHWLDARISTSPLWVSGNAYVLLAVESIGDEKRREVLERITFGDVLEFAGDLGDLLGRAPEGENDASRELRTTANDRIQGLVEVVQAHRNVALAERGELEPTFAITSVSDLIDRVAETARRHAAASGREIEVRPAIPTRDLTTDRAILECVLDSLVLNALEATETGNRVTLQHWETGEHHSFAIHNAGRMPEEISLQIFQRSFSTKGRGGHGIGTYAARLLTERFLNGTVMFTSNEDEGTTFVVELP